MQELDPSGVDALYTMYRIQIRGFVAQSEGMFPGVSGTTPVTAATINAIKAELETPRISMEYRIAGNVIVSIPPGGIDAKLGPFPLPCVFREQTNTGTFYVECGCVVRVVDCKNQCAGGNDPVLSLRWTQSESFDENWYSRLTTDGHLIVRADFLLNADNYRFLTVPPILPDYIRTASKYTLSPDGLTLNFHFEDEERDRLPPFPATRARGSYTVQSHGGVKRIGSVRIRLEGQKGTSRKTLMIVALAMAYSKLREDKFFSPSFPVITGKFEEDLFDPIVEIQLTALMANINKNGLVKSSTTGTGAAIGATFGVISGAPFGLPGIALGGFGGAAIGNYLEGKIGNWLNSINPFGAGGAGAINAGTAAAAAAAASVTNVAAGVLESAENIIAMGFNPPANLVSIMPSVGADTFGLGSGKPGIAPPDRKRISGLLTALFRDPCLCLESEVELSGNVEPPTAYRNSEIVNPVELVGVPRPGGAGAGAEITIGATRLVSGEGAGGWLRDRAPYDTYEIHTTTNFHEGTAHLPGTGSGHDSDIAAFVTVAGQAMQVTVTWVAGRTGSPPQLPTYQPQDSNLVAIAGSIVAKEVVPNMDGSSLVYMVSGYYIYGVKDPAKYQITPAVPPMFDDGVRQGAADAASYWTDTALWAASDGVVGGLAATTDANPFVTDGVSTTPQPVPPPNFDLSNLTSDQLNTVIQTGQLPTSQYFPQPPNR